MEKDGQSTPSDSGITNVHEAIRRRAEQIYIQSGQVPGRDLENWAQAEREVRAEVESSASRKAIVVKINGVTHVGAYRAEQSDGYLPGEFISGEAVEVRIDGDRMLVRRANGKDLETKIVKRVS